MRSSSRVAVTMPFPVPQTLAQFPSTYAPSTPAAIASPYLAPNQPSAFTTASPYAAADLAPQAFLPPSTVPLTPQQPPSANSTSMLASLASPSLITIPSSASTAASKYAPAAFAGQAVPPPQVLGLSTTTRRSRRTSSSGDPNVRRISSAAPEGSTLAAVVITICRGTSFDQLFQTVPQVGDEGTHVATYTASGKSLFYILRALNETIDAPVTSPAFMELLADIRSVDPSSVVFNWECCSVCSEGAFQEPHEDPRCREVVMDLMQLLLRRGHMVMCSDFSLKALIKQWSERRLGPNPFVKIGEFGGSMQLHFDPHQLSQCPSAQLQKAGEMSSDGTARLRAMPSTIAYTIDMRKADTSAYTLQVLTVASGMHGVDVESLPSHLTCEAGGHRGAAGHVLLRYPSGGLLLVSGGHWIELSNIGVTEERLLEMTSAHYGAAYSAEVRAQFSSCTTQVERSNLVQTMALQYVQQSPPCSISLRPSS